MTSGIWQIFSAFVGIVLVIFLAYFLTKLYAKKFGASFGMGRNIKVIDKLPVGKASSIAIIEIAEKQYLIGITENNINMLKELEEPVSLEEQTGNTVEVSSFLKTLKETALTAKRKTREETSEGSDSNEDNR